MNEIRNAKDYWDSFVPIDRESILIDLSLSETLAYTDFKYLPSHIRNVLYQKWDKVWKNKMNYDLSL